ncbi:hypothetical protein C1H46_029432, partial [Malus baccata]
GSVLRGGGSAPLPEASAEDWVNMINGFQKGALSSRLGIPTIYRIDSVHGHNNVYNATIFPHNVGLGATRLVKASDSICFISKHDRALFYFYTKDEICHHHLKAALCNCITTTSYVEIQDGAGVTKATAKITTCARNDEDYSSKKVAACAKHFVGDGGTSKGINEYNTVVDQQELLSIHMPAYSDSIIKGVSTVMISYSSWNGKKMHAYSDLITDFLKGTLKFMVPINYKEFINLINLVQNNVVPMDRIDDAAGRILLVKFTMGLFENPLADFSLVNELGSQRFGKGGCQKIRRAFEEWEKRNITDPVIPLPKKVSKILVTGCHADNLGYQCGGWTIAWQGFSGNKYTSAWLPGSEGQGITDVLFGDHGFIGKLPRTWFRTVDQLPMNVGDSHYDPLFPFGFGLETESVKELVTRSTSAGVVARPCILIIVVALIISL